MSNTEYYGVTPLDPAELAKKADKGGGNATGTWPINVTGSATTLQTARTVRTDLGSTTAASFDGSTNITPGVTGVLPVANGGTGASTAAAALTNLGAASLEEMDLKVSPEDLNPLQFDITDPTAIAIKSQNNLAPQAGFGAETTVPVVGQNPFSKAAYASRGIYVDKEGQKCIFFIAEDSYANTNMVRSRIFGTSVSVDSGPVLINGTAVKLINNMGPQSLDVTTIDDRRWLYQTHNSSQYTDWTLVVELTSLGNPAMTGLGTPQVHSFHYAVELNRILRLGYYQGIVGLQSYSTGLVLGNTATYDLKTLADYTGGEPWTAANWTKWFGSGAGIGFSYSFYKKEIALGWPITPVINQVQQYRHLTALFDVPDTTITSGGPILSKYSTYEMYGNYGGSNGVVGSGLVRDLYLSWDPNSQNYNLVRINGLSTDRISEEIAWGLADFDGSAPTASYLPIPDNNRYSKNIRASGLLIGASNIAFAGGNTAGATHVSVPYAGTTIYLGNTIYDCIAVSAYSVASVATVSFNGTNFHRGKLADGSAPANPIQVFSETASGWIATTDVAVPPDISSTYYYTSTPIYDTINNQFIVAATKTSERGTSSNGYTYLLRVSSTGTVTELGRFGQSQTDVVIGLWPANSSNPVYFEGLGILDDKLIVSVRYTQPGNGRAIHTYTFDKNSVLSGTAASVITPLFFAQLDSTAVANLGHTTSYHGGFTIGLDYAGKPYLGVGANAHKVSLVTVHTGDNVADFMNSKFFGGPLTVPTTRVDITTSSSASLSVTIPVYPLFIGGYQCTTEQQTISLLPNKTTYVLASKSQGDYTSVSITTVDYLPPGQSAIFNTFSTACIAEVTTDATSVVNQVLYPVSRAPTYSTPSQFDNDSSVATTQFVRRQGLQYSTSATFSTSTTLTADHAGSLVIAYNTTGPITFTMPASATFPDGGAIAFINASGHNVTLQRTGLDGINPGVLAIPSLVLKPGDTFTAALHINNWECTGGSAALPYIRSFASSLTGSGYQMLPSGLILQWGSVGFAGSTLVTYPISFPNQVVSTVITNNSSDSIVSTVSSTPSLTGFSAMSFVSSTGSATTVARNNNWQAIGW